VRLTVPKETIRTNKDLDLPTEKQMLAMFRCEELQEAAYAAYLNPCACL
jgi:hypothetical protein